MTFAKLHSLQMHKLYNTPKRFCLRAFHVHNPRRLWFDICTMLMLKFYYYQQIG